MRTIATVTRVTGSCIACYEAGDKIIVNHDNACIEKERSDNLCIWALNAILTNMCRIRPGETALASCPDPATGHGGNVIFRIEKEEHK